MPIYVYKCTSCEERREIFMPRIPEEVPQRGPTSGCAFCHGGHLELVVGEGVIARFGVQWMQKNMIDRGQVQLPGREPGDLGIATEQNLKRKYARHIAENPA